MEKIKEFLADQKQLMLLGIDSLGLHLHNFADKRLKPTSPEVAQEPQKENVNLSTGTAVNKPRQSPAVIADAIVRHIEVDLQDINRDVARSPQFRAGLEKIIGKV